ncbi:hypothetical protein HDU97_008433 [Phlyctochytrium planicorne]|nr:hypothetical protein HDU97_008433 [Phlyctochytrium planicorne]
MAGSTQFYSFQSNCMQLPPDPFLDSMDQMNFMQLPDEPFLDCMDQTNMTATEISSSTTPMADENQFYNFQINYVPPNALAHMDQPNLNLPAISTTPMASDSQLYSFQQNFLQLPPDPFFNLTDAPHLKPPAIFATLMHDESELLSSQNDFMQLPTDPLANPMDQPNLEPPEISTDRMVSESQFYSFLTDLLPRDQKVKPTPKHQSIFSSEILKTDGEDLDTYESQSQMKAPGSIDFSSALPSMNQRSSASTTNYQTRSGGPSTKRVKVKHDVDHPKKRATTPKAKAANINHMSSGMACGSSHSNFTNTMMASTTPTNKHAPASSSSQRSKRKADQLDPFAPSSVQSESFSAPVASIYQSESESTVIYQTTSEGPSTKKVKVQLEEDKPKKRVRRKSKTAKPDNTSLGMASGPSNINLHSTSSQMMASNTSYNAAVVNSSPITNTAMASNTSNSIPHATAMMAATTPYNFRITGIQQLSPPATPEHEQSTSI